MVRFVVITWGYGMTFAIPFGHPELLLACSAIDKRAHSHTLVLECTSHLLCDLFLVTSQPLPSPLLLWPAAMDLGVFYCHRNVTKCNLFGRVLHSAVVNSCRFPVLPPLLRQYLLTSAEPGTFATWLIQANGRPGYWRGAGLRNIQYLVYWSGVVLWMLLDFNGLL